MRPFFLSALLLFSLLLMVSFTACDNASDEADSDHASVSDQAAPDDLSGADDDADQDDNLEAGDAPDDQIYEPPLGDNPAFGYGPYKVVQRLVHLPEPYQDRTAYLFVPESDDKADEGPYPTIVWGHGIYSANWPIGQREMFERQASRGYLVVYPNMDVPFPFPEEDSVTKGIITYLAAIKKAVRLGLADPDRIIFGGYSFGARIAALATALTTGMDRLDIWPNPIACVFEALPDFTDSEGVWPPVTFYGPRPSEWAPLIDPAIPITVICAEDDRTVLTYDKKTGEPENGAYFFEQLPSEFAQLIILKSGSTSDDKAQHSTFMAPTVRSLDSLDLWGHIKIVAGITNFHFKHRNREWAYGFMRAIGGLDHANQPMIHEVYERHNGQDDQSLPPDDNSFGVE